MPGVNSSMFSVAFPDVVRYSPTRDRYGMIIGWDLENIREPYRKNFKSEEHYLRWKRWCESNYDMGRLLSGKDYRAWLAELNLPTTVQKDELFNVLRFGHEWCKKNIAPKNIRIGYGVSVPMPEPEEEDDDFENHVEYI
tara:strand:+ start:526 stop:942 length:417 start_codon:yes stop_codon:yes gene_type:complete